MPTAIPAATIIPATEPKTAPIITLDLSKI